MKDKSNIQWSPKDIKNRIIMRTAIHKTSALTTNITATIITTDG